MSNINPLDQPECGCSQCRTIRYQNEQIEQEKFQEDFNTAMDQGQRDMSELLKRLFNGGGHVPQSQQPQSIPQQHQQQLKPLPQGADITIERNGRLYVAKATLLRANLADGSQNVPIGVLTGVGGTPQEAEYVLRMAWNGIAQYGGVQQ